MLFEGLLYKYLVEVIELKVENHNIVVGYATTKQGEMQESVISL